MTYPERGFGSISSRVSGVSLEVVSSVKIPKACEVVYLEVMLAVQKTDSAFQRGLGGKGSDMAAKGVKTGS